MRYIRPNSLTWWAGCLAVLTGVASVLLPATSPLAELSRLVALLDRIERGFQGDD